MRGLFSFSCTALAAALLAATPACGGGRPADVPQASPDARELVLLKSNQDGTVFYVDDKRVGVGRYLTVLVSDGPHRVKAKPPSYIAKEEYLKPPYGQDYEHSFTFLIEDQERYQTGTANVGAVAATPANATPATEPTPTFAKGVPRLWTFVVGVSQFKDPSIALQFADKDARTIDEHFSAATPTERRVLLTNEQATRASILSQLTTLAKRTSPDDLLVIFFATHGLPDTGGDLYFLAHDTDPKALVATGLPQRDLEYALGRAPAKRIAMFLDACHSGSAGFTGFGGNRRGLVLAETNRLLQGLAASKPGIAVLSASTASESSLEGPQWGGGHGVFSFQLARGMKGAADSNKDGLVTVRELFDFVYREVSSDTQGAQHPELKGSFDNVMPVSEVK